LKDVQSERTERWLSESGKKDNKGVEGDASGIERRCEQSEQLRRATANVIVKGTLRSLRKIRKISEGYAENNGEEKSHHTREERQGGMQTQVKARD
jgi:hypothetical protein